MMVFCPCVTKQDPMGPSWDGPLPYILGFRSSLKYLDISIWSIFPESLFRSPPNGRNELLDDHQHTVLTNIVLCRLSLSPTRLFATPWTVFTRLLCPWGFSRQEYRSVLSCPSPRDLLNPGIKPSSAASQAESSPSEPARKPNVVLSPHQSNSQSENGAWADHTLWDTLPHTAFKNALLKTLGGFRGFWARVLLISASYNKAVLSFTTTWGQ